LPVIFECCYYFPNHEERLLALSYSILFFIDGRKDFTGCHEECNDDEE
jgi:hypothetical protein